MALVDVEDAKAHLRITDTDHDADVAIKVEQASAIITDYLKARLVAIASITAANPAVVTTTVPHSLVSGSTSTIAGTTTTPTINGARVITVTSLTTFTVPVTVTAGQASAAGTVASPIWNEATAPLPVQAATLVMLGHLWEHRGDDMDSDDKTWAAIERLLVRFRDPALA